MVYRLDRNTTVGGKEEAFSTIKLTIKECPFFGLYINNLIIT